MANVMLSLMHKLGLDDVDGFGDSTGESSFAPPTTDRGGEASPTPPLSRGADLRG